MITLTANIDINSDGQLGEIEYVEEYGVKSQSNISVGNEIYQVTSSSNRRYWENTYEVRGTNYSKTITIIPPLNKGELIDEVQASLVDDTFGGATVTAYVDQDNSRSIIVVVYSTRPFFKVVVSVSAWIYEAEVNSIDLSPIVNKIQPYGNPYFLNASKLNSGAKFWNLDSTNAYYGGSAASDVANDDGSYSFSTPYKFRVIGMNLQFFAIVFDTSNNQFPPEIVIDGKTYENTDGIFMAFGLNPNKNLHIVEISKWNTPNFPLRMQGIYANISIEVDNRNMLSIKCTTDERADNTLPSWGIISNTGSLEFTDYDDTVKNLIDSKVLNQRANAIIYLSNTLVKEKSIFVGEYYTTDWEYDTSNKAVSIQLSDYLLELQDIVVDRYNFSFRKNMYDIYEYLCEKTPEKYKRGGSMFNKDNLPSNIKSLLQSTVCEYTYMKQSSLWEAWNKLCEICGLYIYSEGNLNIIIAAEF